MSYGYEHQEAQASRTRAGRGAERRRNLITIGAIAAVVVVITVVVIVAFPRGGGRAARGKEVIPPAVAGGSPAVQPAAMVVPENQGIRGVVAYDTAGWPSASRNGPAARALRHNHVPGPVTYSVTPPVGGDHNPTWLTCGVYDKAVPNVYAVHDLEHGAVWITYRPSLSRAAVASLRAFVERQRVLSFGGQPGSRYIDLTPYPGLPAPEAVSSWGFQLRLSSPSDPRLQEFVSKFRASSSYTPEYGGSCVGGIGTPMEK